jgi:heat shock protein 1/8
MSQRLLVPEYCPVRVTDMYSITAIAYGLEQSISKEQNILVLYVLDAKEIRADSASSDYGGGTLDVSILSIDGGIFEVKATGGGSRFTGGT